MSVPNDDLPVHEDDALAHWDHDYYEEPKTEVYEMNRAGLDDNTPVDKFLECNGDNVFITEVENR